MLDFTYHFPTKIIFGKNAMEKITEAVQEQKAKNIMIQFGGGSVIKNGILKKVTDALDKADVKYTLLGGVSPNPKLSFINKAIDICKEKDIDFLLAVGGGSVIDSCKATAAGAKYNGDVWDFLSGKALPIDSIPLASVLTLSAAGSEVSPGAVVTKEEGGLKRSVKGETLRPVFAILNPENTYTVSKYQTACGIVDIMMHTIERYFTKTQNVELIDEFAEGLLRAVIDAGKKVMKNLQDYDARATLMLSGSFSHNDFTGMGRQQDWGTHKLEHEVSGIDTNIAHGAGLAVLFPAWAQYVMDVDIDRFCRFAKNVWGISANGKSKEELAKAGIKATADFFKFLEMPSTLTDLGLKEEDIYTMSKKCFGFYGEVGAFKKLSYEDMVEIYKLAL